MTANEYAKQQGFSGARKIEPWRGYACYEAIYGEDGLDAPIIGYPQIILQAGEELRFTSIEETMQYMRETNNDV